MSSPFNQFARVSGRFNSLAPFYIMSGKQESITGHGDISVTSFNTKLYTTDSTVVLRLNNGSQDGQLKKMTFSFKGVENSTVVVECAALMEDYSQIVFSEVGDQILLMWNGKEWVVLETLNIVDPRSQTPVVE